MDVEKMTTKGKKKKRKCEYERKVQSQFINDDSPAMYQMKR